LGVVLVWEVEGSGNIFGRREKCKEDDWRREKVTFEVELDMKNDSFVRGTKMVKYNGSQVDYQN
jgi:hypothetical protein